METRARHVAVAGAEGRLIGVRRGDGPGPMLLCVAALHGNEPSGVEALERVFARLEADDPELGGAIVGLSGNLGALARHHRFIDEDLNRVWQRERVAAILESLRAGDATGDPSAAPDAPPGPSDTPLPMIGSAELAEQRALLAAIRGFVREARGPVYVLDLHTTSSESAPFTTLGDTLQNRVFALHLPIPVVLGLEEQIDGAMLQYFDRLGWCGIGVEGGAHRDPASASAHEATVWILLEALGVVPRSAVPDPDGKRDRLARAAAGLPRVVDVRYRHAIAPEDAFAMDAGFRNFQPIRKGQRLGSDARGAVNAPEGGLIFMPLYQKQGDDGFFIVRPVRPVWLGISRWLRGRRLGDRATWIPGVLRHPDREDAVILAPWASNRAVIGLLHLLGYNVRRERGRVVMVRRVETARPGGPLDLME